MGSIPIRATTFFKGFSCKNFQGKASFKSLKLLTPTANVSREMRGCHPRSRNAEMGVLLVQQTSFADGSRLPSL
jgi:hypothetical protein